MFLGAFQERSRCLAWAKSGSFERVEGKVEDYHPIPTGGHGYESFTVAGVFFQYTDGDELANGGLTQTPIHGGPVLKGKYVRICYHEGRILKVEVAQ